MWHIFTTHNRSKERSNQGYGGQLATQQNCAATWHGRQHTLNTGKQSYGHDRGLWQYELHHLFPGQDPQFLLCGCDCEVGRHHSHLWQNNIMLRNIKKKQLWSKACTVRMIILQSNYNKEYMNMSFNIINNSKNMLWGSFLILVAISVGTWGKFCVEYMSCVVKRCGIILISWDKVPQRNKIVKHLNIFVFKFRDLWSIQSTQHILAKEALSGTAKLSFANQAIHFNVCLSLKYHGETLSSKYLITFLYLSPSNYYFHWLSI